jgi:hypothetical protein
VRRALSRVVVVAEMQGRDLARRHVALTLLVLLPLAFYFGLTSNGPQAVIAGGISAAFSMSGAAIFSELSGRAVDQRLVLAGFRPFELVIGRLVSLEALALPIVAGTAALMAVVSGPSRPWILGLGVALVALIAVPFGLAVGALLPKELEATLVLIGVVGMQLSIGGHELVGKFLPFWGPRRLLSASIGDDVSVPRMVAVSVAYGTGLFVASLWLMARRVAVRRHGSVQ